MACLHLGLQWKILKPLRIRRQKQPKSRLMVGRCVLLTSYWQTITNKQIFHTKMEYFWVDYQQQEVGCMSLSFYLYFFFVDVSITTVYLCVIDDALLHSFVDLMHPDVICILSYGSFPSADYSFLLPYQIMSQRKL